MLDLSAHLIISRRLLIILSNRTWIS